MWYDSSAVAGFSSVMIPPNKLLRIEPDQVQ